MRIKKNPYFQKNKNIKEKGARKWIDYKRQKGKGAIKWIDYKYSFYTPLFFPKNEKRTTSQTILKFPKNYEKLYINIPVAYALTQMPSYAKFLNKI